jgi:transmembrane sensor
MTGSESPERAMREAADWCARLNSRTVSTLELEQFYRWRREPDNAAAYAATERGWRAARGLGADRDIAEAVGEILARPAPRPWWQGWRGGLGLAFAAVLAGAFGIYFLSRPLVLETGVGEQRLVSLADGSRVRLDTHSRVEVRLYQGERDVKLTGGQAFFEVAKDPYRPFIVTAQGSAVRALGTRFGVRSEGNQVSVVLAEGSVKVAGARDGTTLLHPGEAVTLVAGRVGAPGAADLAALTSWTTGRLVFRDTALADAVTEMNRYARKQIVLDSARAASVRVNGVFDSGDSDGFVTAVSAIAHLRAARGDGEIHLAD